MKFPLYIYQTKIDKSLVRLRPAFTRERAVYESSHVQKLEIVTELELSIKGFFMKDEENLQTYTALSIYEAINNCDDRFFIQSLENIDLTFYSAIKNGTKTHSNSRRTSCTSEAARKDS